MRESIVRHRIYGQFCWQCGSVIHRDSPSRKRKRELCQLCWNKGRVERGIEYDIAHGLLKSPEVSLSR